VHVEELHAADLLQLLLDPAACLQRVLQAAADRLLVVVAGGSSTFASGMASNSEIRMLKNSG
jgi:hypothetical protein